MDAITGKLAFYILVGLVVLVITIVKSIRSDLINQKCCRFTVIGIACIGESVPCNDRRRNVRGRQIRHGPCPPIHCHRPALRRRGRCGWHRNLDRQSAPTGRIVRIAEEQLAARGIKHGPESRRIA